MDKELKKRKIILIVGILALILIMSGASFAYLRAISTQSGTNQISTIDCLDITFTENNEYNLVNEFPRTDADGMRKSPYSFSVTNNCTAYINLDLGYEVLTSSNLSADYIKASFNDKTPSILSSNTLGTPQNGGTAYIFQTGIDLFPGQTKDFTFRMWLDEATTLAQAENKVLNGHVIVSGTIKNKKVTDLAKGDLITMDIGDGLPDTYKVLKLDGTEALVLAMQDYQFGVHYNNISTTTSFNGTEGQQYAGSDLDILLNTTMYGEMNAAAKSAIVAKNIDQNMFSYSDEPNTLEQSEPYTYEYQYQYNWRNNNWENSNLVGTVNVGSRYVYALDVADIYEYIGRRYISSSELNGMFFNRSTAYTSMSPMAYYSIWLRSAASSGSYYVWHVNGGYGAFIGNDYNNSLGARAAFVIDLSKIEYEEIEY